MGLGIGRRIKKAGRKLDPTKHAKQAIRSAKETITGAVESLAPSWMPQWAQDLVTSQLTLDPKKGYKVLESANSRINRERGRLTDKQWNEFSHVFGDGFMGDYGRHIFNTVASGDVGAGYAADYGNARRAGFSADEAFKQGSHTLGTSAKIGSAAVAAYFAPTNPYTAAIIAGLGAGGGTALQGGNSSEILTDAAVAGGTSIAAGAAGAYAQGAAGGAGTLAGRVAGGAVGGGVGAGLNSTIQGGNSGQILNSTLAGAAGGGVGAGAGALAGPVVGGAAGGLAGSAASGGNTQQNFISALQGGISGLGAPDQRLQTGGGNMVDQTGYYDPATGMYYGNNGLSPGVGATLANPTGGGGAAQQPWYNSPIVGQVLNAGLQLYGANQNSQAIKDSQAAQNQAAQQASLAQLAMYEQNRQDAMPWQQLGTAAVNTLGGRYASGEWAGGFNPSTFQTDPGYQFRLSEGQKALERSAAAKGGALSGAQLKGAARYGQDFASNEYTNVFNRYWQDRNNQFNSLSNMAGLGQVASGQLQSAGQNYGNNQANIQLGLGGANANAAIAQGQNRLNMATNIGQGIQDYTAQRRYG